jgi:hypothetical protein
MGGRACHRVPEGNDWVGPFLGSLARKRERFLRGGTTPSCDLARRGRTRADCAAACRSLPRISVAPA